MLSGIGSRAVSNGVARVGSLIKPLNIVRTKRTKAKGGSSITPQTQRIITQLSVLSARKKVPKLLKLSREDLIKHQTIETAWSTYRDIEKTKRQKSLKLQYNKINEAMTLLAKVNPVLYRQANVNESGKIFPMELRVPTNYPPKKIWYHDYKKE